VGIGVDAGLQKTFFAREDVRKWASDFTLLESGDDLWKHPQGNPVGLAKGLRTLLGDTGGGIQLLTQGFEGNFSAVDADVVQTFTTGVALSEDSRLRTTLSAAEALFDTRGASWIAVFLEDASKARRFADDFEKRLAAEGLEVDAIAWQDERVSPFYVGVMNFLYMMGASFFLLISGVVALAVVNSVLLTSLERFRETGTLRAVGYLPGSLAKGFATEVFLLGAMASATGCAVAHVVSAAINAANLRFKPPGWADTVQFMLTPNAASGLTVSFVLVGVATLAAFLTALHTARQPVVVLLGEERA